MIISEALHPSITRGGFGYYQRVPVSKLKPTDFPATEDGLWLPPLAVAEQALPKAIAEARDWADAAGVSGVAEATYNNLVGSEPNDLGCWVPEKPLAEWTHTEVVWEIAGIEMRKVLNAMDSRVKERLRICRTRQCLNTRHYDFTFGVSQRHILMEIDPDLYTEQPDGTILTKWGDALPSLADSIAEFRKLQRLCPPYADEKTSPLTANGISKITIIPETGCWEARTYYTKHPDIHNYQYDGYGRLGVRKQFAWGNLKGAQALAHRVVWAATGHKLKPGMELNHLCGFRPCCNPLHIEQVPKNENGLHAARMRRAKQVA